MSDTYRAVYDATRSRIHGCDVASVVSEAARAAFDVSHARVMLQEAIARVEFHAQRPSVLFRPTVAPDGDKWCALYGPNLMEGVSGFGDTPDAAMVDFDANWTTQRTPMAAKT